MVSTPEDTPLPNLLTPEAAYAINLPANISSWDQVIHFGRVYLQNRTMDDLVIAARLAASQAASKLDNNGSLPMLLDLPCTMFAIKAASAPDLMLRATKALRFAPAIIRLAEKVVAGMGSSMLPAAGTSSTTARTANFNGLHLRLEQDAKDWTRTLGGTEVGPRTSPHALPNDAAACTTITIVHLQELPALRSMHTCVLILSVTVSCCTLRGPALCGHRRAH